MLKDFFLFKRMVIPYLVQILFWLGAVALIALGSVNLAHGLFWRGIATIVIGPIFLRFIAEYFIVLFRINDTLTDIKEMCRKQRSI